MSWKKVISVLLTSVMIITVLSACGKNDMTADAEGLATDVIEINSPEFTEAKAMEEEATTTPGSFGQFYVADTKTVPLAIDGAFDCYVSNDRICVYDNVFYASTSCGVENPDGYSEYFTNLYVYDYDNDIHTHVQFPIDNIGFYYDAIPFVFNDEVWAYVVGYDAQDNYIQQVYNITYNKLRGETHLTPLDEYDGAGASYLAAAQLTVVDFTVASIVSFNGGIVVSGYNLEDDVDMSFVIDNEGLIYYFDCDLWYVNSVFSYDNNHIVFYTGDECTVVNTTDYTVEDVANFNLTLVGYDSTIFSVDTNGYYVNTYEGLYYVEPQTMYVDTVFDYNYILGDNSIYRDAKIFGDGNVLYSIVYDTETNLSVLCITEFTETENPYEDREILKLGCASVDDSIVKNVQKFNETNDQYFIEYHLLDGTVPNHTVQPISYPDNRYSIGGDATSFYSSMQYRAQIESQQYSLIQNGSFDLLFGFGSNALFDSERVCVDLDEYSDYLFNDNLYMNVIEAKKSNGSLYQLPLSFGANTVAVYNHEANAYSAEYLEEYADTTISFDDYLTLVDNHDGQDPFHRYVSDYECFVQMISNDFSSYIDVNGRDCDFSSDYFTDVLDYSFKSIKETSKADSEDVLVEYYDDFYYYSMEDDYSLLEYIQVNSVIDFSPMSFYGECDLGYYGVPNVAGNKITAVPLQTLAIYCDTPRMDGSLSFVKYMLSDNAETAYDTWGFCINKNVNSSKTLSMYNYIMYTDFQQDTEDVQFTYMNEFIANIEGFEYSDDIINSVILQSLADYISSHDEIDAKEVTKLLNDSVQVVLDRY